MNKLLNVTVISGLVFLVLEWVFWRSPAKFLFEKISKTSLWWWIQPHYLLRMLILGLVLFTTKVNLWPIFANSTNWFLSLGAGIFLGLGSLWPVRASAGNFWQKVKAWYFKDKYSFVQTIFYLVVYGGFAEELLFRWFFAGILWLQIGWWVIILGPALNIIWHIPYWSYLYKLQTKDDWRTFSVKLLMPATFFAIVLTSIVVFTHNLIGPIIAHAFSDWVGAVLRRDHSSKADSC